MGGHVNLQVFYKKKLPAGVFFILPHAFFCLAGKKFILKRGKVNERATQFIP